MPTEQSRMQLLQVLSQKLGPDAAAALMECLPPFPWTELSTKSDLRALEERMNLRIDGLIQGMGHRVEMLDAKVDGRLDGLEGRLGALIEAKASAQNRALLLAVAAAVAVSLLANFFR